MFHVPCRLNACDLYSLLRAQHAAQQHQVTLTEYYDTLLAREPSPPSESAANPTVNLSLHRLSQVLQATLLSIAGHDDPTEALSEGSNPNAEAGNLDQPPGVRSPSEPRERQTSDAPLLQQQSGLAESSQPNTITSHSVQVESESQAQPSASEPSRSLDSVVVPVIATATATVDNATIGTTTITSTSANPTKSPDPPAPTTHSETPDVDPDLGWSEEREHEIVRLESENAHLRALLGIDPNCFAAAGIPDIASEPPLIATTSYGAPHPPAAGSSAWANAGAETANPFTLGFREDPSVLGLAATSSRLHTLTPPNAPQAMMTAPTSATADPNTMSGAPIPRAAGVFVSASWGTSPAGGNGGDGTGAGVGVGAGGQGQGPVGAPQMQQQRSSPPSLGIAGLARTMELQGPGVSSPSGVGRGRGALFGGRGRHVAW